MTRTSLPRSIVVAIILLTIVPSILGLIGWGPNFSQQYAAPAVPEVADSLDDVSPLLAEYDRLAGPFLHTVLGWSGCCVALVTGLFSFVHYRLKRDVTTPIIGTALFFSGMLDCCNILAADRLTFPVDDFQRFIPFTWAVSRTFNIAILLAGTLPFVLRPNSVQRRSQPQEIRSLILYGLLFAVMSYAIIQIFAVVIEIPESLFPDAQIPRPWDLVPLVLWLITGLVVFPKFSKLHPSLFAHSLIISTFPALASQFHMAFGSSALFDHHFFSAYTLKILAYGIPLIGLILDYGSAHRADVAFRETETKLEAARQISRSLLPPDQQTIPGIEVAGFSYASEAVGGDYYDFLKLSDGRFGVVVGDVSGHDLAASILASQCRAYLRAYADSLSDLRDVITRLNNALVIDTQQRRFITMFCAVLSKDRRTLTYAAAGHQGYLIRKTGQVEVLDSNCLPLGMSGQEPIEIVELADIFTGDQLLIVTDGITEAVSPQGEQYGMPRVLDFLKHQATSSVPELINALQQDVNQFCRNIAPKDDVTVVLVRWTNPTTQ